MFRAAAGIAREKERIERIQQEKQARKAKAQQRRAHLSTAGRPDTAAGDDTSLNSLGMANAGEDAEVEPEGSKARTSRNTPPRSLFLLCCLWCCVDAISRAEMECRLRAGRAVEPRRKTRAAYQKPEPLTQEELERLGFIKKQRCSVCTREYTEDNLPAVVSYRAVERLREGWSAQFGTEALKDARYAAATKLYVRTPLLPRPVVSLPSFLPKSARSFLGCSHG